MRKVKRAHPDWIGSGEPPAGCGGYGIYSTDFGDVRVSEGEGWLLSLLHGEEAMRRVPLPTHIKAKALAVRDACVKFAKYRGDGGSTI